MLRSAAEQFGDKTVDEIMQGNPVFLVPSVIWPSLQNFPKLEAAVAERS